MPVVIDPSAARQNAFNSLNAGLANAQQIQLQRQELYDARKQQAWENVNKMATDAGYRIEDYLKQPAGAKAAQQLFASYGVQMFETPEQQKGFLGNLAEGNIQGMLGALFPTKASRNEANNAGFRDLSHVYTDSRGLQQVREAQAATGDYTPVQEIVQIAPADDSQYQTLLASLQNGARGVPQGLVRPVVPESTPRAPAPASEVAYELPNFTATPNQGYVEGKTHASTAQDGQRTPANRVNTNVNTEEQARLQAIRDFQTEKDTGNGALTYKIVGNDVVEYFPNGQERRRIPHNSPAEAKRTYDAEIAKPPTVVSGMSDAGREAWITERMQQYLNPPQETPTVQATLIPEEAPVAPAAPAGNTGAGGEAQPNTATPAGTPDTWDLNAQTEYVQWLSNNAEALGFAPFSMPRTEEAIRRVASQNMGDATLGKYRVTKGGAIPGSQTSTAAQTSATSASTQTAQTPIDSPSKKLGWSPEDEQLVRDYLNNKPNANDQMNRRAEYLLTQARTQLTRDAVTEIRQSTNFSVGSDWTDPEVLKMTANHRMMTDLNGVFKDDPQMQHLFTNIAHLGIRERESALRIAEAELGLRKEQLDVLRTEAEASKAMAAIEMLKMESEAFRTLLDVTKEQFAPEIQMFQSRIDNAKDDAERGRIMQEARTEILRSPQFQNAYEAARKSAAAGAGLKMTAETFFDETFGWFKRSRTEEIGQGGAVVLDEDTNTGVSATEAASLSASLGL